MKVTNVVLFAVINSNLTPAKAIRRAALQNVGKDDEEELPDSSTAAAALAPESNVEHIKQVQEKMDTGVLDGVADESDRILGKKNKGKKKMFKKNGGNGNAGAIPNPWVKDGSGSGSGSSSDTAMELEEAKERIAELEGKLAECGSGGEDVGYYGEEDGEYGLGEIPDDGGGGAAASGGGLCTPGNTYGNHSYLGCRGSLCAPQNGDRDCYGEGQADGFAFAGVECLIDPPSGNYYCQCNGRGAFQDCCETNADCGSRFSCLDFAPSLGGSGDQVDKRCAECVGYDDCTVGSRCVAGECVAY